MVTALSRIQTHKAAPFAAALPVALLLAGACVHAWRDSGSIAAADAGGWLPYAILAALVLLPLLATGAAAAPAPAAAASVALLAALAAWATTSLAWSPVPSLARDEGLLTAFYAVALVTPLLSLRTDAARVAALAVAAAILSAFALLVALRLAVGADVVDRFKGGRLYFPITYANAQGSFFAVAFWPGVALAARRGLAVPWRALALGAAATAAAAATLAQSKGTAIGLAVALVVLLAVSPARLRVGFAALLAVAPSLVGFGRLTEPFRDDSAGAVHHAAATVLLAAAAGVAVGAVYALADRRLDLAPRTRRLVGRTVALAALAGAVAAGAAFFASVDSPRAFASDKWHAFKHVESEQDVGSHFASLGSNRYDFWRVALHEARAHPVDGCGARCFGPEYLIRGESRERPARAHSLLLEVLAEQGLVGAVLLAAALALLLARLGRLARARDLVATAALGTSVCWLAQAAVDWTWTFAAVTVPALAIAGIGAASGDDTALRRRRAHVATVVVALLVLVALAPPWLSDRLRRDALDRRDAGASLRWSRRLDPLSTAPLYAEAVLAKSPRQEVDALRRVVDREPRVASAHYFLGVVYLNLGRKAAARAELSRALALDPRNAAIRRALKLAA